jgi:hypothetical protein
VGRPAPIADVLPEGCAPEFPGDVGGAPPAGMGDGSTAGGWRRFHPGSGSGLRPATV